MSATTGSFSRSSDGGTTTSCTSHHSWLSPICTPSIAKSSRTKGNPVTKATSKADASADGDSGSDNLPLGTTKQYARMHKWLKRGILVGLVGLVIEGSFTLPFL